MLFTFLGLPWLMIATASVVALTTNRYSFQFQPAVVIIDALQGPALFVIRVVRL